jgi:hypothetical protein
MEEQTNVVQELIPVQEEQGQPQQSQDHIADAGEKVTDSSQRDVDKNWERANEVLKLQKQRIEELESRIAQQPAKQMVQEEPDEFDNLDPNDYLTVDKAKKLAEKLAEKKALEAAKKMVGEYAQQQNIAQDEQRARSKYEDYDYVVENFAIPLIKNDPALAYKVQNSKNPAEVAYKLGKLSDDYEESIMKQQTNPKAEKILKNASRPVSGNAVGAPLKTQADNFSKMSKQEIWELSEKYARRA